MANEKSEAGLSKAAVLEARTAFAKAAASKNPPTPVLDSTKLLRGALVEIDPKSSSKKTFVPFQYNPAELSRSLKSQVLTKNPRAAVRFIGTPTQSISVKVQIEAISAMAATSGQGQNRKSTYTNQGIYAQLAALELMIYPTSEQISKYRQDAESAKLWAVPPQASRAIFVWGPNRALPVQLTEISVKEELFDSQLNPIRAEVDLKMDLLQMEYTAVDDYTVLTYYLDMLEAAKGNWTKKKLNKQGLKKTGDWYG